MDKKATNPMQNMEKYHNNDGENVFYSKLREYTNDCFCVDVVINSLAPAIFQ